MRYNSKNGHCYTEWNTWSQYETIYRVSDDYPLATIQGRRWNEHSTFQYKAYNKGGNYVRGSNNIQVLVDTIERNETREF